MGNNGRKSSIRNKGGSVKKLTVLLVLAFGIMMAIGCGGAPAAMKPTGHLPGSTTVPRAGTVFVGDSLFGRMDLDFYFPGKGYHNGGYFGQRTDQMLARFPAILDGSNVCHGYDGVPPDPAFPFSCSSITPPAEVVILLGWNDLLQAFSASQAAANINQMANMARNVGVKVVLVIP